MGCLEPRVLIKDIDHLSSRKPQIINVHASGMSYEYWQSVIDKTNFTRNTQEATWIPCGKCLGCRQDHMKEWSLRAMAEATQWENNYFVTLTLSDDNLVFYDEVITPNGITYTDDGSWGPTLEKSHVTKFMKDLREYWRTHYGETNIRFYMCGEYGGQYGRPHYHLILFNLNIRPEKLKAWKLTPEGFLYRSEELEKIWGKGFVTVAEVNMLTCQYVAGYVLKKYKKAYWNNEIYYQNGRIPEYNNMSRKPGIGKDYYDQHKQEIYSNDEIIIAGSKMEKPRKPPRYYDKLYDQEEPFHLHKIKAKRKHTATLNMQLEDAASTLTRAERNELKLHNMEDRMKVLMKRQNIDNDTRKVKTR